MTPKAWDRKCRRCGRWNRFESWADAGRCSSCGAEYGRVEVGLDVPIYPSKGGRKS